MTTGEIVVAALTVVAIVAGPIVAVCITRYFDDRRLTTQRRMDVFRTLMRTRRVTLSPDHVGALNLVEIEFHEDANVIAAWKEYFQDLGTRWPPNLEEKELEEMSRTRASRLTKLLHAIAKSLNFQIEQLDIFEGGYAPKGWEDDENMQRHIRYGLLEVLLGRRPFPVAPFNQAPGGPYPEPPTDD